MSGGAGTSADVATGTVLKRGAGFAMVWLEPVLVCRMNARVVAQQYDAYIRALEEEIVEWPLSKERSALYDVADAGASGAAEREAVAAVMTRHRDKLARMVKGFVFCSDNGLVRGAFKVVNWLSPPPYPSMSARNSAEGFKLLAARDPRVQPSELEQRYRAMLPSLGS